MSMLDFSSLVNQIRLTDEALQNNARLVINRHVTAKAWLTGYYIVEYEQNGADKAQYGEQLLQKLAERLGRRASYRTLRLYRSFFLTYRTLLSPVKDFVSALPIRQSPIAKLEPVNTKEITIWQSPIAKLESMNQSSANQFKYELSVPSKERMTEFLRKENEGLMRKEQEV